jgi:ethanolamine utilization protein EutN
MRLGRVQGKVWATAKDPALEGLRLSVMQPVDEHDAALGGLLVVVDTVGSRDGDLVFWVSGAEATFVLPDRQIPSDATIVGLVDRLDGESAP